MTNTNKTYRVVAIAPAASSKGAPATCQYGAEFLGDAYGATYATEEEAQAVADRLQASVAKYELPESTEYSVEEA